MAKGCLGRTEKKKSHLQDRVPSLQGDAIALAKVGRLDLLLHAHSHRLSLQPRAPLQSINSAALTARISLFLLCCHTAKLNWLEVLGPFMQLEEDARGLAHTIQLP